MNFQNIFLFLSLSLILLTYHTPENMEVNLIVAIGKDGAIGKEGILIWKISEDLKRFKSLTTGHPVIMGRKTWESLPKKPLPNRRNIVLTRQKDFSAEGAETVASIDEALKLTDGEKPFVIGGAEIYRQFLPFTTTLYLTEVDSTCEDADAFLHLPIDDKWQIKEESDTATTPDGIEYKYVTYSRSAD